MKRPLTDKEEERMRRRLRGVTQAEAEIALEAGDGETVAVYLRGPAPAPEVLSRVADMLDPSRHGDEKWRLEFTRRWAGNPRTRLDAAYDSAPAVREAIDRIEQARGGLPTPPRGTEKRVVGEVAAKYLMSERALREAISRVKNAGTSPPRPRMRRGRIVG